MHHTQALKTLLQCLEELTTTIDKFGAEEKLHAVEKDLVLYHGRLLYDAMLKLPETEETVKPTVTETPAMTPPAATTPEAKHREEVQPEAQPVPASDAPDASDPVAAEAAPEEMKAAEETANEEVEEEDEREEDLQPEATGAPEVEVEQLTFTLSPESAEKPAPPVKVRYEKFSIAEVLKLSGEKDVILTHLKLKPITDLKSGIGLNEKFLFIRELFANDHEAYAAAIEALNSRSTVEEAEAYIADELLPHYGWDMEKEALANFLHLILRRFSA